MLKYLLPIMMIVTSCQNFNRAFHISENDPIEVALETSAEKVIELETGIHVHLTPDHTQSVPIVAPPIVGPQPILPSSTPKTQSVPLSALPIPSPDWPEPGRDKLISRSPHSPNGDTDRTPKPT